jgi:hypothetical protein
MHLRTIAFAPLTLALTLGCADKKSDADQPDDKQVEAPSGAAKPDADKPGDPGHGDHAAHAAAGDGKPAAMANGSKVFFKFPQDKAKVFSPVALAFGLEGKEISPAGQNMEDKSKGHHHVVIDGEPVAAGTAVPADDKHVHFGKGQTEAKLELKPGKHKLTMQFADGAHLSYGPELAATIEVDVVESKGERKVFFVEPADGAKVKSPLKVKFGLEGMTLRPAGEDPLDKTTGHHHLIIDDKPVALGTAVPADDKHIHFGKAQTETEVTLDKGEHTLTLQLADGAHLSYGPDMSATLKVTVE